VENVGYLQTSESDPGTLNALLGQFASWPDVASFWSSTGAGIIQCVGTGTDDAGLSYECGNRGTVDSEYGAWYVVYAHELGRNCCLEQGDDVGNPNPFICIMFARLLRRREHCLLQQPEYLLQRRSASWNHDERLRSRTAGQPRQ